MSPLPGVNLPYFFDAYGHDLAPNAMSGTGPREVDPMRIYRPLLAAHEMGFQAVRLWLCEGGEGILMNAGTISGVHPVLVESVAIIQECASLCGLRLYWTLLDGHSWERSRDAVSRAILSGRDEARLFADRVAAPLARRLDPRLTLAVEVVNEPEALTAAGDAASDESRLEWEALGAAIKTITDAVRSERGATIVTAGSRRAALPSLWRVAPGLDAIDIHLDPDSPLPPRSEVISTLAISPAQAASMPLIAGCCRVDATAIDAAGDGYSALFHWRLEDLIAARSEPQHGG